MDAKTDDVEKLLFIMANLPEYLRSSMARKKINELIVMNEPERMLTTIKVIRCLSSLKAESVSQLICSWIKEMCKIDPKILTDLMLTYCEAFENEEKHINAFSMSFLEGYNSLLEVDQDIIMTAVKEALFLRPDRKELIKSLPNSLKNTFGLNSEYLS